MSEIATIELIKTKHLDWIKKIRKYLDNKVVLKEEIITSHLNCDLGKWYYSEGKQKYGDVRAIRYVELKHEKLHKIAKYIWHSKKEGDNALAEVYYKDLLDVSNRIIAVFTKLEDDLKYDKVN